MTHYHPLPLPATGSFGGDRVEVGGMGFSNMETDRGLREQGEELARLETYALDVDFHGRAAEEWGAKPMSTRSFVTRQRDHRRDRRKPE